MTVTNSDLPEDDRADLGVLFVHGIGDQARGETLLNFGEPLLEWVRQWMRLSGKAGEAYALHPVDARLREPQIDGNTPAHVSLVVGREADGRETWQGWLLAEAWWGAQAMTPRIAEFTGWLLTRGAWTLLLHLVQVCLLSVAGLGGWRRKAALAVLLVPVTLAWGVASMAINALLLTFATLALVPIGWLRNVVYAVLRALAGVIGDAYLLIRSRTQAAAFERATFDALAWLAQRAHKVVVVAHSQGAAIAHAVLQSVGAPRVAGFASVGSGLVKLEALRQFEKKGALVRVAPLVGPPLAALAAAAALRWWSLGEAGKGSAAIAAVMWGLVGLGMVGIAVSSAFAVLGALRERSGRVSLADSQPGIVWRDVASTHDPVPAGNLGDWFDRDAVGADGHRIPVLSSALADHTNYWQSHASLMPVLAGLLDRVTGGTLLRIDGDARLQGARRAHAFDVGVISLGRLLEACAVLLPLAVRPDLLAGGAAWLRDRVRRSDLPVDFVDKALCAAERAVQWAFLQAPAPACGADARVAAGVDILAALLGLVAALLLWRRVVNSMWQEWSASRHADALRAPSEPAPAPADRWVALQRRMTAAPATAYGWFVAALLIAVLALPLFASAVLVFDLHPVAADDLWSLPILLWTLGMFWLGGAHAIANAGKELPSLRAWLDKLRALGAWRWDALFPAARALALGLFGMAMIVAVLAPAGERWKALHDVAGIAGGAALFALGALLVVADVRAQALALGLAARWLRTLTLLPALVGLAVALGVAPWVSPGVYWRSVPGALVLVALAVAGIEWAVLRGVGWRRGRTAALSAPSATDPTARSDASG